MHDYTDKQLKFRPHGSGQDKQMETFGKFHNMIILKFQARYDNGIDIENSIQASDIVDIYGIAPERKIYEETDVNKEEI